MTEPLPRPRLRTRIRPRRPLPTRGPRPSPVRSLAPSPTLVRAVARVAWALWLLPGLVRAAAQDGARDPGAYVEGELRWSAYEGDWPDLPDLDDLVPVGGGRTDRVGLHVAPRPDRYALRFEGVLRVDEEGVYRLSTTSDDGSRLYVGDELVVDNGGTHAARTVEVERFLRAGRHALRLDYHEAGGGEALALGIAGPVRAVRGTEDPPLGRQLLWYRRPARTWMEALPVGNGRLGAMVFGGVEHERLQLNEDTVWGGHPDDGFNRGTPEDLARVRALLAEGRLEEAHAAVIPAFSTGAVTRSHQTLGDLWLDQELPPGEVRDYVRLLELASGTVHTSFVVDGVRHLREVFVSEECEVLVVRMTASEPGHVTARLRLTRPADRGRETARMVALSEGRLALEGGVTQSAAPHGNGMPPHPLRALLAADVEGGAYLSDADGLRVVGADAVTLVLAARTDFGGVDPVARTDAEVAHALDMEFPYLRLANLFSRGDVFDRVRLDLGRGVADLLPTDERLAAVKAGASDPGLDALLFQYGRYLLQSCSRPGTQPANLQGLWNEHVEAPWNADYHLNINLQMNYWPAEVTALPEFHEPLFDLTERLAERGAVRARESFGLRGWVAPHATDLWAAAWTRSVQPYWGFWHNGGPWLCAHLMEHWRFTGDEAFLRERAWPLLAGAARFHLDWLVEDPATGLLVSGPSTSPENSFRAPSGAAVAVCMGPAMDQQLCEELFDGVLEAAAALGLEDELVAEVRAARARLAPGLVIGADGRLLEWNTPVEEVEPGHRHMSHLYALHPGDDIDPYGTPELAAAARATIDHRLAHGGAGTGWSRAWMINMMARLHDGDEAYAHLQALLARSIADNLFDLHPPFQIDGNFGATAGVAEMLLQSDRGELEPLPALPAAWPNGHVEGLRARGGFEVELRWRSGRLSDGTLTSHLGRPCRLRAPGPLRVLDERGDEVARAAAGELVEFPTERGAEYVLLDAGS